MNDLLQPTEIALHRSSTASHISSRTWITAQKPGSQSRSPSLGPLPDFYHSTSLLRSRSTRQLATHCHARSGAKEYRTRSRKKVSARPFKTRSVGLVDGETFFCLALCPEHSWNESTTSSPDGWLTRHRHGDSARPLQRPWEKFASAQLI